MDNDYLIKILKKEKKCILFEDEQTAVGDYLRRGRIKKNLTQKEASDDTCSHSYLSKIESNKIKPNKDCVLKLFSKLDIDKNLVYLIENNGELLYESYLNFYNEDIEKYELLYSKVKKISDNQFADTIKLGYYLLKDDIKSASKIVKNINDILSTLTSTNIYIYSLYLSIYLYKINEYKESLIIVRELMAKNIDDKITIMAKATYFNLCVKLNRCSVGLSLYHDLLVHYSAMNFLNRLDELKISYLELLFDSSEYEYVIKEALNISFSNKNLFKNKYNYMLGISYFKREDRGNARKYLYEIEKDSIYYSLTIFERESLFEGPNEIFLNNTIDEYKDKPDFLFSYYLSYKSNTIDHKLFLSKEFKDLYDSSSISLKKKLLNLEMQYFESVFRYKEAYKIYKKMEELSSIKE